MSNNRFMSSSNPFVSQSSFAKSNEMAFNRDKSIMTVKGTVNKTMILTGILFASAILTALYLPLSTPLLYGAMFGGIGLAFATYMKPTIAHITAPLYAAVEGIVIGGISAIYGALLGPGIVFNALMLTILCLASMLFAYKTGMIKPTEKFRSVIMTATGAIAMIYMLSIILNLFGVQVPYLHQGGPIGIGISLFIIAIASLNLILDFDNIESGAATGAPVYMEWLCSLGLLVTLVWIFIEILRLLSMFASSND